MLLSLKSVFLLPLLCSVALTHAQISIHGNDVSVGGVSVVNGVVTTPGLYGNITAGNGAVSMTGPDGRPITVQGKSQQQSGNSSDLRNGSYQRQGDLTINDKQNGQTAIATGNNQTVANSAGNIAQNRSGTYRQGRNRPATNAPDSANSKDEQFWGKGGIFGNNQ